MLNVGLALRPNPDFDIQTEYYTAGSEIVGGVIKLTLSGTHYASSLQDYENMISQISSLNGGCRTITSSSSDCGSLSSLVGAVGFVEDVSIDPGGEVLNFKYSITLTVARDTNRNLLVARSSGIDFGNIPNTVVVNKYSFEESTSMSPLQKFTIDSSGNLTSVAGKVTVTAEIGFDGSDRCDSPGISYPQIIGNFLRSRQYRGDVDIPAGFIRLLVSEKFNISQNGGSVTKEYLIVHNATQAIVTMNTSEQTQQIMGDKKQTFSGSIQGATNFSQAELAYGRLSSLSFSAVQRLMDNTCGEITTLPVELCPVLASSRRTDNEPKRSISFEFTYEDMEKCLAAGYRIVTEYTENQSVQKAVEHIIPGKAAPVVFISGGKTAERRTLKVSGDFTSCNEGFVSTVEAGVKKIFGEEKTKLGISGGNFIRLSRSENTGRYSYSLTEEYIKCE